MITIEPVAYFYADTKEKADVPRQGVLAKNEGVIQFACKKNFEQALEDLEGMRRIWVIFWMHQVSGWKVKVQPPRSVGKKGVFSTRSPHRPNPIGLSCVELVKVSGLSLFIRNHDLLDGTPILDVKPYLPYADSFPEVSCGWLQQQEVPVTYCVTFSPLALRQLAYLESLGLRKKIEERLSRFIGTLKANRTKKISEDIYLQAYKSWRYVFQKSEEIYVLFIFSGYDEDSLEGRKDSKWADLPLHRLFLEQFADENRKLISLIFSKGIEII